MIITHYCNSMCAGISQTGTGVLLGTGVPTFECASAWRKCHTDSGYAM